MRTKAIIFIILLGFMASKSAYAQIELEVTEAETDTVSPVTVDFTPSLASEYIMQLVGNENLWRAEDDSLKLSLIRLVDYFNEPFDSTRARLERFPFEAVALKLAVETLLSYTYKRDSIPLTVYDIRGRKTPYWLTSGKDDLFRYWVRNANDDSVTLWLGNPSKFDITMILEEDVYIERMGKKPTGFIPVVTATPETKLARVTPLKEIPIFWTFGLSSSFSVNWNYLVNWAQGGESSFSGMFDISGRAVYTHKEKNQQWTNSGRLRYGTVRAKEYDFRTNTDIIELNSQYNKKIWRNIDFSSTLYFKSQMAKGYKYPNDSTVVSKFLNPGTFTIGTGIEYKPFRDTQLNFSVLSYKNTFVLDTANINQKAHGIDNDKRARQEMGGQLVIRNKVNILDELSISNTLRLFSNYLNKPQNIDVDWEMNLERQITWFLYLRLNIHLIYDDDIRFPAMDKSGEPILFPDGSQKMVPKTQYNQFLGLTFAFRI